MDPVYMQKIVYKNRKQELKKCQNNIRLGYSWDQTREARKELP